MKIGQTTAAFLLALLLLGAAAGASPERQKAVGDEQQIIHGLKAGIHALSKMGLHEEAERLERILKEYVNKLEAKKARAGQKTEREVVKHRIEVLRIAMKGLLEKEAIDAAHLVEHRIHMYELALEGRRDEEAKRIRETAPKPEQMVGPLKKAGAIWKGFGKEDKAKLCFDLAGQYYEQAKKHATRKKEGVGERDLLKRHVEILRVAMHGLLEAEKKDAAHQVEQAIHVYELALEGHREKAMKARERAPNSGQLAELLLWSGKIWAEFGHEKKAAQCEELGKWYQQRWRQQQKQKKEAEGEKRRDADGEQREMTKKLLRKIEELEKRIRELEERK
ncbi:MAG: hypothetical protein ABFS86_14350 [Planctomycetota bacterium]